MHLDPEPTSTPRIAYCTLVTNDEYVRAACVLRQSLKQAGTKVQICSLFTPEAISETATRQLEEHFDVLIPVDTIEGKPWGNLGLIGRPDLASTLTKLHLWNLTQFDRVLYLDADTLVISNVDHLFGLPADIDFAASPELGFPDCFNSGVMLLRPDYSTFFELCEHALTTESFDGGDQGLLNIYFGDGSRNDLMPIPDKTPQKPVANSTARKSWFRLGFTYNMEMHKVYRLYIPAVLRYKDQHHILHFIGKQKPWHFQNGDIQLDGNAGAYDQFYSDMVKRWWKVEETLVHALLTN